MPAWVIPVVTAAVGGTASAIDANNKRSAAERHRKEQAEVARWSPWTGMQASETTEPDDMGTAFFKGNLQGGMAGMAATQNVKSDTTKPDTTTTDTTAATPPSTDYRGQAEPQKNQSLISDGPTYGKYNFDTQAVPQGQEPQGQGAQEPIWGGKQAAPPYGGYWTQRATRGKRYNT